MIPFLKYKEGVIPGKEAVKRPSLSQEGKVGTKKRYEAEKRQRKFKVHGKKIGHGWILWMDLCFALGAK